MKSGLTKPRALVIAGPTGAGKSALALRVAEAAGGVIINADATQLYRDLRVLTARPTSEEEARVPHRLYGLLDGAVAASAARWAEWARNEVRHASAAGRLPVLVGGTGLYLRTLIEGIAPVPEIPDAVRAEVRLLQPAAAYAALERADCEAAEKLAPNDWQRVARALEVVRATGKPLTEWQQQRTGGMADEVAFEGFVVEIGRDCLAERLDARLVRMVEGEALEEVERLLARELAPELPVMKALGVAPLAEHLRGERNLASAIAAAQAQTRQYAKRQRTWFRHQAPAWTRLPPDASVAALLG